MTGLPELRERLREEEETAAHEIEFEELIRRIPRLVGILPEALRDRSDARHNVALAKMISGLVALLDEVQPHALVSHVHRSCYEPSMDFSTFCSPLHRFSLRLLTKRQRFVIFIPQHGNDF